MSQLSPCGSRYSHIVVAKAGAWPFLRRILGMLTVAATNSLQRPRDVATTPATWSGKWGDKVASHSCNLATRSRASWADSAGTGGCEAAPEPRRGVGGVGKRAAEC